MSGRDKFYRMVPAIPKERFNKIKYWCQEYLSKEFCLPENMSGRTYVFGNIFEKFEFCEEDFVLFVTMYPDTLSEQQLTTIQQTISKTISDVARLTIINTPF